MLIWYSRTRASTKHIAERDEAAAGRVVRAGLDADKPLRPSNVLVLCTVPATGRQRDRTPPRHRIHEHELTHRRAHVSAIFRATNRVRTIRKTDDGSVAGDRVVYEVHEPVAESFGMGGLDRAVGRAMKNLSSEP